MLNLAKIIFTVELEIEHFGWQIHPHVLLCLIFVVRVAYYKRHEYQFVFIVNKHCCINSAEPDGNMI